HLGLYTVVMAHLVGPRGRVLSFEPTPSTRTVLAETVRLNGFLDRVEIRAEAITREVGSARFYCTGDDISNANSLVPPARAHAPVTVGTTSVDAVARSCGARVALLKVDAEGAELDVLAGARQVFATARPAICLALHPPGLEAAGKSLSEIWDL